MQELRAQIQAQLKLADTLKKISEAAGRTNIFIDNGLEVVNRSLLLGVVTRPKGLLDPKIRDEKLTYFYNLIS